MKHHRNTWQKKRVQEVIDEFDHTFRVEEIHTILKEEGIGIATIYRHLAKLRKDNEIHHFTCDGRALYSKHNIQHTHFHCSECDSNIHIPEVNLPLGRITGGKIESFQLDIRGICKECVTFPDF
tara:strand:+ start:256 stop:627 length:372 start_codon:yes stop_codon:yes gene_type:complete